MGKGNDVTKEYREKVHREAYGKGYKEGKSGGFLSDCLEDFGDAVSTVVPFPDSKEQSRRAGYRDGAAHRYDNSGGSSSSGGSSGSSCYLTTACVGAMGLPDNCLELNVLRAFRDRLLKTPEGRRAVEDYEIMAPRIVQAVSEREGNNANSVWRSLYSDIKKAVESVLSGDYEQALQHYKEVTLNLKRKYLG